MLKGGAKIIKYTNGVYVTTYEFSNTVLRDAKNDWLGAGGDSNSHKSDLYLQLLRYTNPISEEDYRNAYYNASLPSGYYCTDISWVKQFDNEGHHFIATSQSFLGPHDLYGIALRFYRKDYSTYYHNVALLRLPSAISFTEADSYVIQYKITMRW